MRAAQACHLAASLFPAGCKIAENVAKDVHSNHSELPLDAKLRMLEMRAVIASLNQLRTFPFVREREADGRLRLHGCFTALRQCSVDL